MTTNEKIEFLESKGFVVLHSGKFWVVERPDAGPFGQRWLSDVAVDVVVDVAYDALSRQQVNPSVDDLLAQGAEQMSRKYRLVARLPEGMTALEALKDRDMPLYERVMADAERRARELYRLHVAKRYGDYFELSVAEFNEFLVKTGRSPGPPLGAAHCPECRTLTNNHAKSCTQWAKRSGGSTRAT